MAVAGSPMPFHQAFVAAVRCAALPPPDHRPDAAATGELLAEPG